MIPSNKEWRLWGRLDPLYGVASWRGKAKDEAAPWTVEEFFELGVRDWADFKKYWERYGLATESVLEIGCGAGRITKQLASSFARVVAVDVSDSMVAVAREHITSPHVTFHVVDGATLPVPDASIASVFSCHVFQHFESIAIAEQNFREIARALRPGGTMMIHLPIYDWPASSALLRGVYALRRSADQVAARVGRVLMDRGLIKPIMRMTRYPINFFYRRLPELGFSNIELAVFATSSNADPHPFVFATRA